MSLFAVTGLDMWDHVRSLGLGFKTPISQAGDLKKLGELEFISPECAYILCFSINSVRYGHGKQKWVRWMKCSLQNLTR
jgi:hypothetical protein